MFKRNICLIYRPYLISQHQLILCFELPVNINLYKILNVFFKSLSVLIYFRNCPGRHHIIVKYVEKRNYFFKYASNPQTLVMFLLSVHNLLDVEFQQQALLVSKEFGIWCFKAAVTQKHLYQSISRRTLSLSPLHPATITGYSSVYLLDKYNSVGQKSELSTMFGCLLFKEYSIKQQQRQDICKWYWLSQILTAYTDL